MTGRLPRGAWTRLGVGLALTACSGGTDPAPGPPSDRAPSFTSAPVREADHNRPWSYTATATDPDGDPVTISAVTVPAWADFDSAAATLSGTPGWDNVGSHEFRLSASAGALTRLQIFDVEVARGEIVCDQSFGAPQASEFALPYRVGAAYTLIQGYCPPNPAWGHHNWFAYDFDLADGDTVLASRGGEVLFVQEDRPNVGGVCGQNAENFVFIQHADRTVMHYVHLITGGALVAVGDTVTQGQPIGLSGNSGCSAGPHLHVALFRDRSSFDRKSTLPFNYRNADGPLDEHAGLVQGGRYAAVEAPARRR